MDLNAWDIVDLKGIAYQQSMAVGAQIELEAMKSENALREQNNEAPAYGHEAFMELIERYGLGHNTILDNTNPSCR